MNLLKRMKWRLSISWRFFAGIAVPLALLPLIFIPDENIVVEEESEPRLATKFKTLYVLALMSIFWMFEVIPLPVTSLIPLVLLPLMGIQDAEIVSQNYTKESNMIFLGGVIIALGVEYCNLHRRVALRVMVTVGASPPRLLFGTMIITAFLSMWISPTTCIAALIPVLVALIDEIHKAPEVMSLASRRPSMKAPSVNVDFRSVQNPLGGRRYSSALVHLVKRGRRPSTVFENAALSSKPSVQNPKHLLHRASIAVPPTRKPSLLPSLNREPGMFQNNFEDIPIKPKQLSMIMTEMALENPQSGIFGKKKQVGFSPAPSEVDPFSSLPNISDLELNALEEDDNDSSSSFKSEETIEFQNGIKKMFLFGMAFAANLGGTAVITGSSPNKIFKELLKPLHFDQDGKYRNMTFFLWMALNIPPMIIEVLIAWIFLVFKYYFQVPNWKNWNHFKSVFKPKKKGQLEDEDDEDVQFQTWKSRQVLEFLRNELIKIGPIGFHEAAVGTIFMVVVVLWIFRDPEVFPGWDSLVSGASNGESTAAMFGVVLLFAFPKDWSFLTADKSLAKKYEPLLDWGFVAKKLPWGVLLLLGSGFAISDAVQYSGLSFWIGTKLHLLEGVSEPLLLLLCIIITNAFTQLVPNVACANILLPIMFSVSINLRIHPLYLTVAATISCSHAFMLPVSAPSNAIVFAAGDFTTMEMVKNGLFLNIVCICVLYLNTLTLANWMFQFSDYEYAPPDHH